jgi:hypothetical protein
MDGEWGHVVKTLSYKCGVMLGLASDMQFFTGGALFCTSVIRISVT